VYKGDYGVKKGSVIADVRQMNMELEIKGSKTSTVSWVYQGNEFNEIGEAVLVAKLDSGPD